MKRSLMPFKPRAWLAAASLALISGILLILGVACHKPSTSAKPADVEYYTCSMHPSVKKMDPKDKCPICSMDLVPVKRAGASGQNAHASHTGSALHPPESDGAPALSEFTVPVARQQQIGVTYAAVEEKPLQLTLRTVGLVAYDKLRHWEIVTRVDGYVEQLFIASQGELVEKDQPLITIYSPELLTTQQEFIDLLESRDRSKRSNSSEAAESLDRLIESAKKRLRLWNINDGQIEDMERTRQAQVHLTLHSPVRGLVQNVQASQGSKVTAGEHLVEVTDLSVIWVWAEFFQEELPLLETNAPVKVMTSAYPGETFQGQLSVIDPFLNQSKRVARARIDVENSGLKLRPEMFVDIELERDFGQGLTVPLSAVMPTGKRHLVFVEKGGGKLEPRFVELGRKFGPDYEVRGGLKEGERVVASGNFLIDAEAKVQGALKAF